IQIQDRIRVLGEEIKDVDTAEHQFFAHIILPFDTLGIEPGWKRRNMQPPPLQRPIR
ncbi:MAG: hypothetical protein UV18_C0003G0100, partial [Candidatus Magasanikbacteria bacterium GW2011_GWC2_42_27]